MRDSPLSPSELDRLTREDGMRNSFGRTRDFDDPIPLDVPMLPPLPRGIFPQWAESFIDAVADATETPRELAAMMELGTIATALQRKFIVQVEPGYAEPLNLWLTPALPSGNRKTQVLRAVTKPLRQWEAGQLAEIAPRIAEAKSARETALARIATLRKKAASAERQFYRTMRTCNSRFGIRNRSSPIVPGLPKLWAQDVTPEKLGALMAEGW